MAEAFELAKRIWEDGLTIFTVFAILGFFVTIYESRRKRLRYERMESKIDAIGEKVGYTWTGQPDELQVVLMSLRQWRRLYSADAYQAVLRRRRSEMDKRWLIAFVAYILSLIAAKWGIEFADGAPEKIIDAITSIVNGIMVLATLVGFWVNRTKKPAVTTIPPEPQPLPQHVDPDNFIQG